MADDETLYDENALKHSLMYLVVSELVTNLVTNRVWSLGKKSEYKKDSL